MALAAGTRLGAYEVVSLLGVGGMGEVYKARDARLGREVAIKVLPPGFGADEQHLKRFEQEARAASALNHPNIVTVYDVGREGEISFQALELVVGSTLRELLGAPIAARKALAIAAQLAEGLAAAHARGIAHRDLKPENVMVTREGLVKILDFGLAKLFEPRREDASQLATMSQRTAQGTILGTVGYMSPEQAAGSAVDYRSDQFSFGAILYEMLSGRRAFRRSTAAETLAAIIREEPEPLDAHATAAPAPLLWVLERCLAKEPEERYGSTRDLARDLAKLREHSSDATAVTIPVPGPSTGRRRAAFWLVAAALAVTLAAGLWLGTHLAQRPQPRFQRLTFQHGRIFDARFAPDGQTVLYSARWGSEPQVYSTRMESRETRPLGLPGVQGLYSVSGNADLAVRIGSPASDAMLARVPLAGGAPRELQQGVSAACWLPDGSSLAAVVLEHGRARIEMPLGRKIADISSSYLPGVLKASPDGKRLAYLGRSGTTSGFDVCVVEANGAQRVLTGDWPFVHPGGIAFSPDGREVWFAGDRDGSTTALQAVSLDGRVRLVAQVPVDLVLHDIWRDGRLLVARESRRSSLAVRLDGDAADRDLSWLDYSGFGGFTPDGKSVAIVEYGQGGGRSYATYLRKVDGSPAVRITDGGAVISPDGAWMASLVRNPPKRLIVPVGPGQPRELSGDFEAMAWMAWFPDSKRVVFEAHEKGRPWRVYVQDVAGGAPRPITPNGFRLAWSSRPVSPDGRSVIVMNADGLAMLVPDGGGEPHQIAGLTRGERPVQWTRDARSIFVDTGRLRIVKVDTADGSRAPWREVPTEEGGQVDGFGIAPDERSYGYSAERILSDLYLIDGLR